MNEDSFPSTEIEIGYVSQSKIATDCSIWYPLSLHPDLETYVRTKASEIKSEEQIRAAFFTEFDKLTFYCTPDHSKFSNLAITRSEYHYIVKKDTPLQALLRKFSSLFPKFLLNYKGGNWFRRLHFASIICEIVWNAKKATQNVPYHRHEGSSSTYLMWRYFAYKVLQTPCVLMESISKSRVLRSIKKQLKRKKRQRTYLVVFHEN